MRLRKPMADPRRPLKAAVDGLGRIVAAPARVEVGQHVLGTLVHRASEDPQFLERGWTPAARSSSSVVNIGRSCSQGGGKPRPCAGRPAQITLTRACASTGNTAFEPSALLVVVEARNSAQRAPGDAKRVTGAAAVAVDQLLDPAPTFKTADANERPRELPGPPTRQHPHPHLRSAINARIAGFREQ